MMNQPVVASGDLTAPAVAGCLSSSSLFPSPPLSRLLLPLFSSADILTVVVSLSSWCGCPVIWPDLIAKVSDGAPVVVLWVTGVSSGVMRGGWLRSQFWISSGCSGSGGDSLLAVLLAVVLGQQSRWQRVLLAPLQIGCSSAVPCPVVLASLSRAESGGWASELQVGGVEVAVCGVCELELRQALVRRFNASVQPHCRLLRLRVPDGVFASIGAPDPACCALQPNPSSVSCVFVIVNSVTNLKMAIELVVHRLVWIERASKSAIFTIFPAGLILTDKIDPSPIHFIDPASQPATERHRP
ncbi:hypothetical protein F2Q68_00008070 [Brassica cretica]|uniref:Uncharacterized protein n=1 Tax=Brassica cretica TaxID=69181 RepID=A0A8S9L3A4_BRACR|nr:hypothetical protein F2Q68_00008070 [Brassica cretica]